MTATERLHPSAVHRARKATTEALSNARAALADENYIKAEKADLFDAIDRCLRVCEAAVAASALDLRGAVEAAVWALTRLPFDAADSQRVDDRLTELRVCLDALGIMASKLGFPSNPFEPDLPPQHLVPREVIANELDRLGLELSHLDGGVEGLVSEKSGQAQFATQDRMIDFVTKTVGTKSRSAAAMVQEHQIDISAVTHTLAAASRHTREFKGALAESEFEFTDGARAAGKELRKAAAAAADTGLKILRNCAEAARDHGEAARQSATTWLEFAAADEGIAQKVAHALHRRGFKLVLPRALPDLAPDDTVQITHSPEEQDLLDFLGGKNEFDPSGRGLTAEEKKLWALVARTVKRRDVAAKVLNFSVLILSEGSGRDVAYARQTCRAWPQQVVVLSLLPAAQTRLLQETHHAVVPVHSADETEQQAAIEVLDQMLTSTIIAYALARPGQS